MSAGDYHVVRHPNGTCSIGCHDVGEVMHPIVGPVAEAESLYVKGLDLVARAGRMDRFCVWDIGMGAAANALVATRALLGATPNIEIISFDHTAGALRFAAEHRDDFQYVADFIPEINELLADRDIAFERDGTKVCWRFLEGDFLEELRARGNGLPKPDAVLFDAWSPLKNSGMWTVEVFRAIHEALEQSCSLATYSRATCVRSALLLAGFFVGKGGAVGAKEESTVAANDLTLLQDPLDAGWLEKLQRSHSGHPLSSDVFTQEPLTNELLEALRNHPQFGQ